LIPIFVFNQFLKSSPLLNCYLRKTQLPKITFYINFRIWFCNQRILNLFKIYNHWKLPPKEHLFLLVIVSCEYLRIFKSRFTCMSFYKSYNKINILIIFLLFTIFFLGIFRTYKYLIWKGIAKYYYKRDTIFVRWQSTLNPYTYISILIYVYIYCACKCAKPP